MSFKSRAAAVAVAVLSVVGLLTQASPVLAAEAPSLPSAISLIQPVSASQVPVAATPAETAPIDSAPSTVAPPARDDEQVAYPTLAAAVADQSISSKVGEELRCLAGAIYFESRGEPLAGQLAVAEVILNRAASGRFRDGVCGVIVQPGQFSFVRGGRVPDVRANDDYRTAMAVAKVAMKDAWESAASNALYFHARGIGSGFSRVRVAAIGNHIFYR
jgi:spore germination cell wall hydrolase CwlJ-like protein